MMPKKQTNYRDPTWFVKQLKRARAFANEPGRTSYLTSVRDRLPGYCTTPLKNGKLQSAYAGMLVTLNTLSLNSMVDGAISIIDNDMEGWKELRRGFLYDAWAARLRHAFVVHDNCYDDRQNAVSAAIFDFSGTEALTLCHAIATGDDDFAHSFGRHLLANYEKTNGGDTFFFYFKPFYPFVLKLYSVWIGQEISLRPDVADPLKRYQQVFDHWESSSDLAAALLDLCDLHCAEVVDNSGYPAFSHQPYNLFPVEIMSIFRIRKELGLETPEVDHPLLHSALLKPPPTIPHVEDALLDHVIRRFRSDFPDGKDWR